MGAKLTKKARRTESDWAGRCNPRWILVQGGPVLSERNSECIQIQKTWFQEGMSFCRLTESQAKSYSKLFLSKQNSSRLLLKDRMLIDNDNCAIHMGIASVQILLKHKIFHQLLFFFVCQLSQHL